MQRVKEGTRASENKNMEISGLVKREQEERLFFVHSFKKIGEVVACCKNG
jgi:hypothetical protein